jgi:acyl carrier protein
MTGIVEQIKKYFEENFMIKWSETFSDEDSLLENGIIDSTGVLELVLFIEKNYGIKIADDELVPENLDSLINIKKFVEKKLDN